MLHPTGGSVCIYTGADGSVLDDGGIASVSDSPAPSTSLSSLWHYEVLSGKLHQKFKA